jgi:MYXO-CTERM domain-containing protein
MSMSRLLALAATALLPLAGFALVLAAPTADACHELYHGCPANCRGVALVCQASSGTMELTVSGVHIVASLRVGDATTANGTAKAGDQGSVVFSFQDASNSTTNRTVRLTTAFNQTSGIAWDSGSSQAIDFHSGQPQQRYFFFHIPANTPAGTKHLNFTILGQAGSQSQLGWGTFAFKSVAATPATTTPTGTGSSSSTTTSQDAAWPAAPLVAGLLLAAAWGRRR